MPFPEPLRERINLIVSGSETRQSALIPVLRVIQNEFGYLSNESMEEAAGILGIPPSSVQNVATFYTMFFRKPVGEHVIWLCRTLSCALRGAERLTEEMEATLGCRRGETDPTGTFTLLEVECLGACDRAPVVMVNTDWHECQQPEDAGRLVDQLKASGTTALSGCHLGKG